MSERMKRRKKGASRSSREQAAAPEPLQPKYFEDDIEEKPAREMAETAPAAEAVEPRREGKPEARMREPEPPRVREPQPQPQTRPESVEKPRPSEAWTGHPQGLEPQAESEAQTQAEMHARPEMETAAAASTEQGLRPTRRRRRRGGRGGARRAPAEAASQASSAAAPVGAAPIAPVSAAPEVAPPPQVEALATEPVAAELQPAVPAAAPARPSKGIVVLAIGLPGSGKTTWFKRHEIRPLSSDMVRTLLFDDVHEQRFQDLVFSNLRSMLKARLIAKRPMNYVDATNLTPQERQHWIKLAKDFGYEVHAVFFDVPLEVCVERHQRRDRVVPEEVMRRMAAKLKPPTFEEGFARITVVRVKRKEDAAS